jgi:hypothetical protein
MARVSRDSRPAFTRAWSERDPIKRIVCKGLLITDAVFELVKQTITSRGTPARIVVSPGVGRIIRVLEAGLAIERIVRVCVFVEVGIDHRRFASTCHPPGITF